jgi:hypothetical protein
MRQSASWGDGVYKTTDGGICWEHLGLDEDRQIGPLPLDVLEKFIRGESG